MSKLSQSLFTPKFNLVSCQIFLTTALVILSCLPIPKASAQNIPKPSDAPLELNLLAKPDKSVVTANTINLRGLTVPSLWWTKANTENKLLDNWIAYPATQQEPARVDVLVNQQVWSLLDYLERYDFVNRLGTLARSYGYNVRVFNYQQEALANYTCSFDSSPSSCNIQVNTRSESSLRQINESF
jgi:hypothetical protein